MSEDDRDVFSCAYRKPIHRFSYFGGAICFPFIEERYEIILISHHFFAFFLQNYSQRMTQHMTQYITWP